MKKRKKRKTSYFRTKANQVKKIKHWVDVWKRNRKRLKKLFFSGCGAIAYILEKKNEKEI